jgi:uncharacterized protein (TIGR00369 family)
MRSADPENEVVASTESAFVPPFMLILATSYGKGDQMSDHLKEISPAAVLLGREIVSVDTESGEVRLRFLADRQFSNRHGTVQGGMLAAMLDSATGNAVIANLPSDRTAVTTRLDTTFVKPAALGPLTATARLVKLDDRSASAEAELIDESGQVVARARAELRVRERSRDTR